MAHGVIRKKLLNSRLTTTGLTTDGSTWQFWWNPIVKCVEEVIAAGLLWVEPGRGIFRTYSEQLRGKFRTKLKYGIFPAEIPPPRYSLCRNATAQRCRAAGQGAGQQKPESRRGGGKGGRKPRHLASPSPRPPFCSSYMTQQPPSHHRCAHQRRPCLCGMQFQAQTLAHALCRGSTAGPGPPAPLGSTRFPSSQRNAAALGSYWAR